MRATIYTENAWIELGITAKMAFLKCLQPDENGEFDTVIEVTEDFHTKIRKLTDKDLGMERWKDGFAEKMKKALLAVPTGKRILLTDDFVHLKGRMEVVKFLNKGMTLEEATIQALEEFKNVRPPERNGTGSK